MTRLYIQPSWIDAASGHDQWSGGNGQYRGDRSVEVVPTYVKGKANMKAFSDDAINARKEARKSSLSIQHRILPQAARVERLTQQMRELCAEYKAGNMDIQEYSQLLDIITAKRDRSIELLNKAKNTKPKRFDDEAVYVNQEEENVDFKGENPTKQSVFFSKYKESLVFWGFASIMSIVMLILSH